MSSPAISRCTGHCCRDFVLSVSPGDLVERSYSDPESKKILAMLDYHGTREAEDGSTYQHYGCKNLLPNGDCGIYESRPEMCRRYPTDGPCRFEGCTFAGEVQ